MSKIEEGGNHSRGVGTQCEWEGRAQSATWRDTIDSNTLNRLSLTHPVMPGNNDARKVIIRFKIYSCFSCVLMQFF